MKPYIILGALLFTVGPVLAADLIPQRMTTDQAYKAIPHARTVFTAQSSSLPKEEAQYLANMFYLVDVLVTERVQAQKAIYAGDMTNKSYGNYGIVIAKLENSGAPSKLRGIVSLIADAAEEQQKYFEKWQSSKAAFNANDSLVNSSSSKLREAYSELMKKYPDENAHNKQAFFDHLCAMDFK